MKLVFSSALIALTLLLVLLSIINDGLSAAITDNPNPTPVQTPEISNYRNFPEPPYRNPRKDQPQGGFSGPHGEPKIIGPSSNPPNY